MNRAKIKGVNLCHSKLLRVMHYVVWLEGYIQCNTLWCIMKKFCPVYFFPFYVCRLKTFEIRGGWYVKKVGIWTNQKNLITNFLKLEYVLLWPICQFSPKSNSNLRFFIRDSRVRGLPPPHRQGPESLNLGWKISNLSYF